MSALPKCHADFRTKVSSYLAIYFDASLDYCRPRKWSGYSYSPEVIEVVEQKFQEILEILETGRTLYNEERQKARIAELRAKTAEADPRFSGFMQTLTQK